MKKNYVGEEKRQHPRVEAQIPVRIRQQGETGEITGFGSLTGDVSAGGLMFRTKELISTACNLILEFDLPTTTQPIVATSRVAWKGKATTGGEYTVGNEFMEITKKDQEQLSLYVNGL
jgi:c-di-GMP-binding flagellar brake protein YcgR